MVGFTQTFGGTVVYASDVSYRAVALSADVTLTWPTELATNTNVVASIMDVTPTTTGLTITMPAANQASVGETALFFNAGSNAFTVADAGGNTIISVAAGIAWQVYLTGNSTVNGTWRATQYGAGTSSASAGSLVGSGIKAINTTLNQSMSVTSLGVDYSIGNSDRAGAFVWTGGAGTLTLPSAATVGNDWFFQVRNGGTGAISIAATGGQLINGGATLTFNPGDSAIVVCDGSSFFTIGFGQSASFAFDFVSIDLTSETSPYTLSGANLNRIAYRFSGTLTTNMQVIVPSTIQQYWIANETDVASAPYTIEVKTLAGTGIVISRNARAILYCNGTDVIDADTNTVSFPISVAQGGTGATTDSGARVNLGGTSTGIAVFTAVDAAAGRTALSAAKLGANSDITSLSGLTTPLSVVQGGTGQATYTNGQLLIGNTTGNTLDKATLTAGTNVSITNGAGSITINATDQYAGTVTSVSGTGTVNGITLTGAVTSSGSLTLGGALSGVSLATQVTGTLPVGNGGTGATTLTSGYLVKGNGASAASASVVYDDGTNVGIGTATPGAKLDVIGDINSGPITVRPTGGEGGQISLQDPTGTFPAYNFDVDGSGDGRLFTSLNNTNLLIGQLTGTGGVVTLNTAGNERMRIDATGNVGIGTSAPGYRLDVAADDTLAGLGYGMRLRSNATAGAATFQFTTSTASAQNGVITVTDAGLLNLQADGVASAVTLRTAGNERMRVDASGNVGIGTTSPQGLLQVTAGTDSSLLFRGPVTYSEGGSIYAVNSVNSVIKPLEFAASAFLFSNGDVGIGTTTPGAKLGVAGSGQFADTTYCFTAVTAGAVQGQFAANVGGTVDVRAVSNHPMAFFTNNAENMRIDATGNVGIGTSVPGAKLDVAGGTVGTTAGDLLNVISDRGIAGTNIVSVLTNLVRVSNGTDWTTTAMRLQGRVDVTDFGYIDLVSGGGQGVAFGSGGAERMRIDATGNVGIGNIPSGTYKLEVTGATYSSSMVLGAALPVASGGSGQTSYTDGQLLIGNTVGNTLAKATLTAGSGISITNGNGSITITSLAGGGSVTSVSGTGTVNGLTLTGTVTTSGSLTLGGTLSGVSLTTQVTGTLPIANGGTGATTAAAARTALGATTLGANVFAITNPSAITFPRFNADNTVSALDAATFRTAIGAGAGTVTSVGGTGTVNGLTLTGTVTSSGSLTLGGTLSGVSLTTQVSGTLPVASGGTGQTTYTNGQLLIGNTTGNTLAKATLTAGTGIAITNGAGTITIAATGGSGTVTSVSGAGTVNGLTLTGTVTSTGSLTLGGTLSGVSLTTQVSGTLPIANGGTGATTAAAARTALGSTTVGDGVFTAVNAAAGRTALSAAASGANSDITALDQDVTITVTGTIAADTIGFRGIPQNAQTASYTLALSDAGRHISNTTGGFVIPANGTVPFPIGTTIVLFNNSASSQSVTITTDTLRLAGTATTGTRTLAQYGLATCVKVTSTVWVISGAGLT